jgi:hypothetical protein
VLGDTVPSWHSFVLFVHRFVGKRPLKVMVRFQGGGKGVSRIAQRTEGLGQRRLSVVSHGGGKCGQ